ncbi:tyrosine-type recombinase/integrase [Nocardioides sp. QY071]|uniref:site-specific integrase n=1 Tax=Nocardioides sp. QY071 TaxID=3044187 RepID=UPI00249A88A8|nr:tyrosine-type recombinase/integrase [Nocardioides sp. QY071]WGY01808.1 tyrosine-type recombinase/integrase [Nocardioides sp. QY071]
MWEIRIAVGRDPLAGTPRQRSFTVHGTQADAEAYRDRVLAEAAAARLPSARHLDLARLLQAWLDAEQGWKPSTRVGYRSVVRFLTADPLGQHRAAGLTPHVVRSATARWEHDGASIAVVGGRLRALRSALTWAWNERILPLHPLRGMRGPGRPAPRRPLPDTAVGALLTAAEMRLLEVHANHRTGQPTILLQRAEQDLLLIRLAADSGARRGELAALQITDLDGRTLHIDRAISAGVITTPKAGRGRSLTLGAHTADLWHQLVETWDCRRQDQPHPEGPGGLGPWLFAADLGHHRRLGAEVLGHRFARIRNEAGIPGATLHRFRHSVATTLVRDGKILDAQARLGHADAATTLREYAYVIPGTDTHIADRIDDHLDQCRFKRRSPD